MAESIGIESGSVHRIRSENYTKAMTPYALEVYSGFCLSDEFLAIAGRHLSDLTMVAQSEYEKLAVTSGLCVEIIDGQQEREESLAGSSNKFHRFWRLHPGVIKERAEMLSMIIGQQQETTSEHSPDYRRIALDWLFGEMSLEVVGNSIHMQHIFNKYVNDYNGQNPYDSAGLTVSRDFLDQYSDGHSLHDVHLEHLMLKMGIGAVFLRDSLVRNLNINIGRAMWVIEGVLKEGYPGNPTKKITPFSEDDIRIRMMSQRLIFANYDFESYRQDRGGFLSSVLL